MTSGRGTPRRYGHPPFRTLVLHGGPGAPGSMAPVARGLAATVGVLEPWQTARTVAGQVEELSGQIDAWATTPVTLVGHSWGAWLALLLAAEHPEKVRRIVLVGSGPLRARYAKEIRRRRRERLTGGEWPEFEAIERALANPSSHPSRFTLRRFGEFAERTDSYELLPHSSVRVRADPTVFRTVWAEAEEMRRTGKLFRTLRRVRAPVVVVHGTADPHPLPGVVEPLRQAGVNPRVVRLTRCGHEPWRERHARKPFFAVLRREVARP